MNRVILKKEHKRYDGYRETGLPWIGEVPEGWSIRKLKFCSNIQFSSVDKHIFDDENEVSVCNYTDVYYGEIISASENFRQGSCTPIEYKKYRIKKGDVIITKDSESADDIAISAYIEKDFENVVCGYHLALIRTSSKDLYGKFLFRFFQADRTRKYFELNANGITRFGLGKAKVENLFVPVPLMQEQTAIANYLDEKTALLDRTIKAKRRQIDLLKEKRTSLINRAVTKGIDEIYNIEKLKQVLLDNEKYKSRGERNLTSKISHGLKEIYPEYESDIEQEKCTRERPDIVLHQPGNNKKNFIAFEVKIDASSKDAQDDIDKLNRLMLNHYDYEYAIFVDFGNKKGYQDNINLGNVGYIQVYNGEIIKFIKPKRHMRDSGIERIGEIPNGWEVKKLKYSAAICNGKEYKDIEIDEGGYPVFGSGGEFTKANTFIYNKPSVLLGRKGTINKPLFIDRPFWTVDTMFYTKIFCKTCPKFFYYQCLAIDFDKYQYGSAIPSMTQGTLSNIYFSTPNFEEQEKIVDYLDSEMQKIDETIALIENSITLLDEYKTSLISNAVTGKVKIY
ncbi:MAG: restriction endonuclease subunit S [Patescibacteria group bacterium]|nr:restriction endonuclease subunit S [Patescibacteria group bacterium]